MHGLARSDAEQDSQDLEVRHLLRERGIKAAAALFDECKVESSGEGNCLEVSSDALRIVVGVSAHDTALRVGVGPGNRSELREVREPTDLPRAIRFAARQISETRTQIDCLGAF